MKSEEHATWPNFQQIFRESPHTGYCKGWRLATRHMRPCSDEAEWSEVRFSASNSCTCTSHCMFRLQAPSRNCPKSLSHSCRQLWKAMSFVLCCILCTETFAQLRTARNILHLQAIMSYGSIGTHTWSASQANYNATSTGTPGQKQASISASHCAPLMDGAEIPANRSPICSQCCYAALDSKQADVFRYF